MKIDEPKEVFSGELDIQEINYRFKLIGITVEIDEGWYEKVRECSINNTIEVTESSTAC